MPGARGLPVTVRVSCLPLRNSCQGCSLVFLSVNLIDFVHRSLLVTCVRSFVRPAFVLTETPYDDGEGLEIRALPAAEAAATMEGVDAVDEASDITSPFDPAMRYRYPARSRIGGVDQSVVLEIGPRFVQVGLCAAGCDLAADIFFGGDAVEWPSDPP